MSPRCHVERRIISKYKGSQVITLDLNRIITADETHVWAEGSDTPVKVRGENGSTIIATIANTPAMSRLKSRCRIR